MLRDQDDAVLCCAVLRTIVIDGDWPTAVGRSVAQYGRVGRGVVQGTLLLVPYSDLDPNTDLMATASNPFGVAAPSKSLGRYTALPLTVRSTAFFAASGSASP
jgi:hypothetical protein